MPEAAERELLLYEGPCRGCGFDTGGYATKSYPESEHNHYPASIERERAERHGFLTVPIPPGVEHIPLDDDTADKPVLAHG